ncbi:site-specific DNA-methyltransferase [Methanobacterium aggregans]|uniref:site-specific DNA-methyltransferase n=1 Tax=Methanobacterium aggregans TaxID=1615586 RepID=UPI001AE59D71|nr:site-specific DNA-methyltransferase [Methanobacterium aggregans]MBP2046744.1 adenine-specific DNA-methyltransferase [Methanobacterium aggregans]
MQETKLNGESLDILSGNVSKLKELFPEIVTEDKIDFEKLKEVLGEYPEEDKERYNFTWKGKSASLRLAQTPSTGTLRPCKEESKNWNNTENLYIEGDNLEVLKLLQKSYYGKIKMIYIDPPYNTGKDFVYKDNYNDNLQNYLELTKQVDSEGNKTSTNSDTHGRYHTNWLNMMYPRLRLARNLLTNDGVMFVSIDDNEEDNLKKLCNEIFGEENFVSTIIWEKNFAPKNDNKYISTSHEYALCYAKNKNKFSRNLLPRSEEHNKGYKNPDNDERGIWSSGTMLATTFSSKYVFGIKKPNNELAYPPEGRCWRYSEKKVQELIDDNRIWFGKDGGNVPRIKRFLSEVPDGIVPQSLWKHTDVGNNQNATNLVKSIFDGKHIFTFPKPLEYLKKMLVIGTNSNDIILDFFSGSATTAHSVMDLNAEDNGNRKFIMVQLPEPTSEKDEAYKAGYKNICEIGKERIRRAGDKIVFELKKDTQTSFDGKKASNLDIGFKVFKLDSSNLQKWDPDYENLEQTLLDSVENLVPGRSELDLVYEIMLKYGIDLTLPIEEFTVQDKKVYSIGLGALLICLEDKITSDMVNEIIKLKEDLSPEIMRVVFKDNGFLSDSDKTNFKETLKTNGIEEFVTI